VIEPTDVKVLMGNLVALNCQADGFPTPTIVWKQVIDSQTNEYRDFKFDPDGSNTNTRYFDNGTLILKNVTNEGSFLCQAKNFIGVISKLIKLSVNGECKNPARNRVF
jgi:Down syndrome cell adhesion molecule